ncbi:MAG TPA: matrixin family metalloprotease [Thermoanaerobaculia bacterium]|nr:matrixin family metalloprotease [Thermoanaerobaculia bacterium]
MTPGARLLFLVVLIAAIVSPLPARGASYLPLPDADLASGAPVVVRARVVAVQPRAAAVEGRDIVITATRFQPLEVLKGRVPGEEFSIELPGGEVDGLSYRIPGTPVFSAEQEVILFLAPLDDEQPGHFRLTEFGLSSFQVVSDFGGRRFAVRPVFGAREDDVLSGRGGAVPQRQGSGPALRDAESFVAALQATSAGADFPPVVYAEPQAETRAPRSLAPSWVNLGGSEGTNRLYRWFWDTGRSPEARVLASGTQSGLSDGSDGTESVANAALQWSGVAGALVRYSATAGSAAVVVNLDVSSHGSYWSEPLSCTSGGVIGLGGPGVGSSGGSYKGDGNYAAVTSGNVWMRKVTGGCYSWRTFRSAVLHEVGHTLGLGHSDQGASVHSTTSSSERSSAVMTSVIPNSTPSTPQTDDIQAIQWLYGNGATVPSVTDRAHPALSSRPVRPGPPTLGFRP